MLLSLIRPQGLIVGGLDQGALTLYDASKLLSGDSRGAVVATKDKHTGPVQALDFNPFQVRIRVSLGRMIILVTHALLLKLS